MLFHDIGHKPVWYFLNNRHKPAGEMFAKPECDNVLQPKPYRQSSEGNTLYTRALQTLIHEKECYIVIFQVFTI